MNLDDGLAPDGKQAWRGNISGGRGEPGFRGLFFSRDRQVNMERQAVARFAFQKNFPLVTLDGFPHEKQFQADFGASGAPVAKGVENVFTGALFESGNSSHLTARLSE